MSGWIVAPWSVTGPGVGPTAVPVRSHTFLIAVVRGLRFVRLSGRFLRLTVSAYRKAKDGGRELRGAPLSVPGRSCSTFA